MRPRLLGLVGGESGLTVLCAPHGFGKTELAAAAQSVLGSAGGRPVIWIPAPSEPMNTVDFRNVVRAAVDAARSTGPTARNGAPAVVVLDRIDRVAGGAVSVIIELLGQDQAMKVVVTLEEATAGNAFAAFASEYVGVSDLRYTADEAVELFCASGVTLPLELIRQIRRRVAGMPALMNVALEAIGALPGHRRDRRAILQRVDHVVHSYVLRNMLPRIESRGLGGFVLEISPARALTPSTVRLLTGIDDTGSRLAAFEDTASRLAALESAGMLLRSDENRSEELYFAPSVRDALMKIGSERGVDLARSCIRLSERCLDDSDVAGAVSYAIEAQAWTTVLEILECHWVDLLVEHASLLRAAVRSIPADVLASDPVASVGRDLLDSRLRPELITPDVLRGESSRDVLNIGTAQSVILRSAGEYRRSADVTDGLVELVDSRTDSERRRWGAYLPTLRVIWGVSYQLTGNFEEADRQLTLAYDAAIEFGPDFVARHAAGNAALNAALAGESGQAGQWLRREDSQPDVVGWLGPPSHVGGAIAQVISSLDALDLGGAEAAAVALDGIPEPGDMWAFAAYARTRLALAQGDPFSGLLALQRAVAAHGPLDPRVGSIGDAILVAARIDLLLASGEGKSAVDEAATVRHHYPLTAVAVARAHLLTGNPAKALRVCAGIDSGYTATARVRIKVLLIEAVAKHALGRGGATSDEWRLACRLLDRTGALSTLSTVSRQQIEEMESRTPTGSASVRAYLQSEARGLYPVVIERVRLTKREVDVLHQLDLGLHITEIARALFVSTNTMKSHLRRIYRKLGVHSREEAIAVAHRLSLIGDGSH
ncbi:LuxR family maltose regulon positive regulatory protein [Rhodococcus sp. 27YEA15]|uniref:helix-turn-helix transcriptional regulator n=1 Tax=Rhodococcus sp. 27YEA15 TaxID=3156259 RepID=UPI003C7D3F05